MPRFLLGPWLAACAVAAVVYLAIDRGQMLALVVETWREGPAMR